MKHKMWMYKGTWIDDTVVIVVEYSKGKFVSFCTDGTYKQFTGSFDLARTLPLSWELVT